MHVDGILREGSKYRSLLIFLDGNGELSYINDSGQIVYKDMKKYSIVLFNDAKPHAFISKNGTICRANCRTGNRIWNIETRECGVWETVETANSELEAF